MKTTREVTLLVALFGLAACATQAPLAPAPATPVAAPSVWSTPAETVVVPDENVAPAPPVATAVRPDARPAPAIGAKPGVPPAPSVRAHSIDPQEFIERNDENLLYVFVDMPRSRVHAIMAGYRAGAWVNPCRVEKRSAADGTEFEVEFFLTRQPNQYRPLGESVVMPVIFQDDKVHAIGRYGFKKLRARTRVLAQSGSGCRAG